MTKRLLLVGSNFAIKKHLPQIRKFFKKENINIFSSKKLNLQDIKYFNRINKKLFHKYNFIVCATSPQKQNQIIKRIVEKKIKLDGILLEKPILNTKIFNKFLKYSLKYKIKVYVNFTFENLYIFQFLNSLIKQKNIFEVSCNLNLPVHKDISNWKNSKLKGGGPINYYLIHFIYIIQKNFNYFKFKNLKILYEKKTIKIIFIHRKRRVYFKINKSNKIKIFFKMLMKNKDIFYIQNLSNDWFGRFILTKNNEVLLKKKESIDTSILNKYRHFFNDKFDKKKFLKDSYNLLNTLNICKKLTKKIKF
jgi:hypothetical protein